jgi:hypothetical protein
LRVVGVTCTKAPVESVPVTVIVYVPGGVPLVPGVLGLPPQATCKIRPANIMPTNGAAVNFPFVLLRYEPRPIRVATNPNRGRQSAINSPEPALEDIAAAVVPVVFTVNVAGVPGATELGLIKQVGASAGVGVTAQVNETDPVNPFAAVTLTVEVAEPPGLTEAGVSAEAESEKSRTNVGKTTVSAEPMVTVQVPVPEQPATSQVVKAEPVAAVAVSVTTVPGS